MGLCRGRSHFYCLLKGLESTRRIIFVPVGQAQLNVKFRIVRIALDRGLNLVDRSSSSSVVLSDGGQGQDDEKDGTEPDSKLQAAAH